MKKCNKVNCNELINFNETYCKEHNETKNESRKQYDSMRYERDNKYRKFYNSKAWKQVRYNAMLKADYLCAECLRNRSYSRADVVDHIVELRDDYSKRLDSSNLECLCHSCHNKKTYREKQRRLSEQNKTSY